MRNHSSYTFKSNSWRPPGPVCKHRAPLLCPELQRLIPGSCGTGRSPRQSGALGDQLAVAHAEHPVGQRSELSVVGHQDTGLAFPVQTLQDLHHLGARFAIQVAGGFIGQDEARVVRQRPGDGHPLPLPPESWRGRRAARSSRSRLPTPASRMGSTTFSDTLRLGIRLKVWNMTPLPEGLSSAYSLTRTVADTPCSAWTGCSPIGSVPYIVGVKHAFVRLFVAQAFQRVHPNGGQEHRLEGLAEVHPHRAAHAFMVPISCLRSPTAMTITMVMTIRITATVVDLTPVKTARWAAMACATDRAMPAWSFELYGYFGRRPNGGVELRTSEPDMATHGGLDQCHAAVTALRSW